jgi:hypothetical protein
MKKKMNTMQVVYQTTIAKMKAELAAMEASLPGVKPWLTATLDLEQFKQHLRTNGKTIQLQLEGHIRDYRDLTGCYIISHRAGWRANVGEGRLYDRVLACFRGIKNGPKTYKNSDGGYQAARHMRAHDPDPDNWRVQYHIAEVDSKYLLQAMEGHYQALYLPRFNRRTKAACAITSDHGE